MTDRTSNPNTCPHTTTETVRYRISRDASDGCEWCVRCGAFKAEIGGEWHTPINYAPETPVRSFAYECPKHCGCWWRDNFDGTMSLFDGDQKSCKVCEHLPLEKLLPLSVADHAFIDNRGDGRWLVCVGKVHPDEHSARKECRRWIAAFSKQPPITSDALDAARYRWLRTRINYMDKDRGISTARTAPVLHYKARVWSHESYDMEADTIDATIDRALAKSAATTEARQPCDCGAVTDENGQRAHRSGCSMFHAATDIDFEGIEAGDDADIDAGYR